MATSRVVSVGWRLLATTRVTPSGCWQWLGELTSGGYARTTVNGTRVSAHRAAYEYFTGPIPEGFDVDHLCRNRACINPFHLEAVNRRENVHRGEGTAGKNARKTHCLRNHPLSGDNLYVGPNGRRVCRECHRANGTVRMRAYRAARKAAA